MDDSPWIRRRITVFGQCCSAASANPGSAGPAMLLSDCSPRSWMASIAIIQPAAPEGMVGENQVARAHPFLDIALQASALVSPPAVSPRSTPVHSPTSRRSADEGNGIFRMRSAWRSRRWRSSPIHGMSPCAVTSGAVIDLIADQTFKPADRRRHGEIRCSILPERSGRRLRREVAGNIRGTEIEMPPVMVCSVRRYRPVRLALRSEERRNGPASHMASVSASRTIVMRSRSTSSSRVRAAATSASIAIDSSGIC